MFVFLIIKAIQNEKKAKEFRKTVKVGDDVRIPQGGGYFLHATVQEIKGEEFVLKVEHINIRHIYPPLQ